MSNNSNPKIKMTTEYQDNRLPAGLLSISEVAHFFGMHSSTVRRWGKKGLLKSYAIGLRHDLRFKQEDVYKFLNSCRVAGTNRASLGSSLGRKRQNEEQPASFEARVSASKL